MIVVRLQGIVGREVSPEHFAVVTVGTLTSGHTNNTIPGSATLVLNCRFYDDDVKARTYAAIERVVRGECIASGCEKEPTFTYSNHGELTDNSPEVFGKVRPLFDAVFDEAPWMPNAGPRRRIFPKCHAHSECPTFSVDRRKLRRC